MLNVHTCFVLHFHGLLSVNSQRSAESSYLIICFRRPKNTRHKDTFS